MSLLLDESNTSLNQILRMSLTHSSANLMQDGRSGMTRSLGMTHPRKLWTPPCFSPCFFGKSPCPAWTLPDRGFPCYRFPHAGDRASKVRYFYFFVLNAAIRMTISNSTAPTSIIPKPSDVSHIQMVAAQTIFRFPSILTLLISLSLVAGTAWCRWRGSNPHEFQSISLMRGETRHSVLTGRCSSFQFTPLMREETPEATAMCGFKRFQSTPLM